QTAQDYVTAVKAGGDNSFKMGGTGSKQEDQIITAGLEQIIGKRLTYIPYKGGGDVAAQLVGNHVNSSVNNPIEAVSQWRAGALRPLCVFDDQRIAVTTPQAEGKAWSDVPTCKEAGLDMKYLMLRGIFMPPDASPEQVAYYVGLFEKVRDTPEWKEFMAAGAFNTTTMTGDAFKTWLTETEQTHKSLMEVAGFIAK
uniref:Bug family tripartite tricarboxylate transporter substrate binding protein n=1 Tax=Inquilinus sp. TaxID=1932117 RepID=UPI0037833E84